MSVFLKYLRVLQLSFTDWAHFNKNTKNNKPVWNFQIFCFVVRILFRKSVNNTGKGDFNSFIEKNELIYSLLSTEWPLQCREGKLLRLKTSDLWRFVSKSGKLYWYCFNHYPPKCILCLTFTKLFHPTKELNWCNGSWTAVLMLAELVVCNSVSTVTGIFVLIKSIESKMFLKIKKVQYRMQTSFQLDRIYYF